MGVAAGQTRRRWLLVAVCLAITCALPAVASALPVAAGRSANPAELRARMLASANLPYSGYVESDGALGVPNLGELSDITAMLDGTHAHARLAGLGVDVAGRRPFRRG